MSGYYRNPQICPNLTPQTGPEGGGDGKIDTETYPVDEAISERWYVGNSSGNKRWGFAFSTKKAWKSKIEADVEGAVGTGRVYDRIYCITSRPIPQRKRLDLEKALTDKHGVSVHIFDREWIIERVFQNHHKSLAWEYLRAGAHEPDKLEVGPRDFRRKQAFKEIEARFMGLGSKPHERLQAVTDAFDLAQLSRELERPHNETSQRFELAIIQAEKYGIGVQLLRATYEYAWTKLWWFDDLDAMQSDYEKVEELAFATGEAAHISKVCNLHQILVGQIFRGEEFKEGLNFDVRSGRLKAKLTELSSDQTRPNNALYAEVLLIFHQMNEKLLASKVDDLDEIWNSISKVIDRSQGMGEFPVDFVSDYVSELSKLLPDSRAFDALIEKLTDFVGERGQEIASGEMLLEQGENKLERDKCLEAIRWHGRAVVLLAKEETRDQQARALYLLSVAYRCAGLLWAARSTVLAAIIPNLALSELESKIRVETIPTVLLFTRISLELGHVADFLTGLRLLLTMMQVCPLDDESRDRLADRITEFDRTLSCLFAAIDSSEIARLAALPDVLDIPNFGLYAARLVLLYRLGYSEILRVDGSFPADRPEQELAAMVGELAAMPAAKSLPEVVLVLDDQLTSLATTILGVRITVVFDCSLEGFLAAEAHISALEGFAATLLNSGAFPHLEEYVIEISRTPVSEASVSLRDDGGMLIQLPDVWSPSDRSTTSHYNAHLVHVVGLAICAIALLPDAETTIKTLIEKDRALERSTYFCHSGNSHSRVFGTRTGRLGDFNDLVGEEYPLKDGAGAIGSFREKSVSKKAKVEPVEDKEFRDPKSHKDLIVNSIINMKLWDEAIWRGLGYTWDPGYLPIAGLMFQNERSGLAIFEEWGKRFGRDDKDDRIRVSVVRGIDCDNRSYYRGHISPNINNAELQVGKIIISSSRKMVMEVENQNHLNSFIQRFNETKSYLLGERPANAFCPERYSGESYVTNDSLVT